MQASLQDFINTKKQEGGIVKQGEEATKQGLILPILQQLGWNPFDVQEVFPEYSIRNGRVDYSLRINNLNKVFIEVKKVSEDLEKHQEQLLRYAFNHGVKLAILTNGVIWWFYLPLHEGSWEQRRFYTIDIQSQLTADITEKLTAFLSKREVVDGKAVRNAENIYNSRQKGEIIRDTLPKAWQKLLSESDEALSEVVAETVEKICGYKPDFDVVIQFLKEISGQSSLVSRPKVVTTNASSDGASTPKIASSDPTSLAPSLSVSHENRKPSSFEFNGTRYEAKSWVELYKSFLQLIANTHPNQVHRLTELAGKKRPYFATDSSMLHTARQIPGSDLFFEANLSANDITKLIQRVLQTMNYEKDSMKINVAS